MKKVTIVDYGAGNLGSLRNMLVRKCDVECGVLEDPTMLPDDGDVILPGVGHFSFAAKRLQESGWTAKLGEVTTGGRRLLGICLGAQLLLDSSEEGEGSGLGLIPGNVRQFSASSIKVGERIPHMGWSNVTVRDKELEGKMSDDSRFYFVHSFFMQPELDEHILMGAKFGGGFCAAVRKEAVTGVQFHPEKSHHFGVSFLKAWLAGA